MPAIEAFTEEAPKPQVAAKPEYVCMSLPNQGCVYTAQGEYVCGKQDAPQKCTQGPTYNYLERFTERPSLLKQ